MRKGALPKIRKQSTDINVEKKLRLTVETTVEVIDKVTDEAEVEEVITEPNLELEPGPSEVEGIQLPTNICIEE